MTISDVWHKLTSGIKSGGFTYLSTSSVVFTDTNARTTGDYCGTSTTPQYFTDVVRGNASTGIIKSINIVDYTTTTAVALELWLFSDTFTAPADNAAWTITDAQANSSFLGVIPISTSNWYASAVNKVYFDGNLSMVIQPTTNNLYYAIVARGTTPAWTTAAGLTIRLGILQD